MADNRTQVITDGTHIPHGQGSLKIVIEMDDGRSYSTTSTFGFGDGVNIPIAITNCEERILKCLPNLSAAERLKERLDDAGLNKVMFPTNLDEHDKFVSSYIEAYDFAPNFVNDLMEKENIDLSLKADILAKFVEPMNKDR